MKTALVIVCSLLLAWTNFVPAQAQGTSAASAAPSCHCGKTSCLFYPKSVFPARSRDRSLDAPGDREW